MGDEMTDAAQWVADLGRWALVLAAKLGLPVAVLFALGYALYRRYPRLTPRGAGWLPYLATGRSPGGGYGRPRPCWEVRACPREMREGCPAFQQPEMPCWQAIKVASGGHIDSRCFECSLLLSREGARVAGSRAA